MFEQARYCKKFGNCERGKRISGVTLFPFKTNAEGVCGRSTTMFNRDVVLSNVGETLEDCMVYRHNKSLAYDQGFDEFLSRSRIFVNNGKTYRVHENVNMYLDVTGKCNGTCKFCIARTTYSRYSIHPAEYIQKFIKAYNGLGELNPSVQIVGGEPTLWSGLTDLLQAVDMLECRFPVIGTNGTGLKDRRILSRLNSSSVKWVNLSRHHYNNKENFEIMGDGVPDNSALFSIVGDLRIPVRLQCNMIGGYVDTYGEIMQMIAYAYQKLNIKTIAFALLTPLPINTIYKSSIIKFVELHPANCNKILEAVGKNRKFVFEKYRGGVACYYEIWKYIGYDEPMTVIFKYSDNNYLLKADMIDNCIPDIVMHTNGDVCGSWDRSIKKLSF